MVSEGDHHPPPLKAAKTLPAATFLQDKLCAVGAHVGVREYWSNAEVKVGGLGCKVGLEVLFV